MLSRRGWLALPLLGIAGALREAVPPRLSPLPETRLLFGGDVMFSRFVGRLAREREDIAGPLRDVAPLFSSADIAFVNLEAPFSDRGRKVETGMIFKAEPEMVEGLKLAGIDIVSTANNHARDCGAYGIEFTLRWLHKNGIATVGTGADRDRAHAGTVIVRNGTRFGFLAYTYDQSNGNYTDVDERVAVMDLADLKADMAALGPRADVVIVSMHAGIEYQPNPSGSQIAFAHLAIDLGATLVIGHHPHVVEPCESYRNGVICYSLGNLVFDQFQRQETQKGQLAEAVFQGKRLARYNVLPVDIVRTVPRVAGAARAISGRS